MDVTCVYLSVLFACTYMYRLVSYLLSLLRPPSLLSSLPPFSHRGSAESHHLGHGDEEHAHVPKHVQALSKYHVTDAAVGSQHCLALTSTGDIYGWGKNTSGEVNSSGKVVSLPKLIPEASKQGVVYIACGADESFACCRKQVIPLGTRLPFCVDISLATFKKLNQLLQVVCEGLDGSRGAYPPPHQDQECMAVSTLNLLRLQVS